MNRRQFISLGGASILVLTAFGVGEWGSPPLKDRALARPSLLSVLEKPSHIRELGYRYRSVVPEEGSRKDLVAILRSDLGPDPCPARLEEQVRRDFDAGRTVQLDGWVLSVTEARQCALYSILY